MKVIPGVHFSRGPFGTVDISKFFKQDLYFLAIGSALRDEVKTLNSFISVSYNHALHAVPPTFAFLTDAGVSSVYNC